MEYFYGGSPSASGKTSAAVDNLRRLENPDVARAICCNQFKSIKDTAVFASCVTSSPRSTLAVPISRELRAHYACYLAGCSVEICDTESRGYETMQLIRDELDAACKKTVPVGSILPRAFALIVIIPYSVLRAPLGAQFGDALAAWASQNVSKVMRLTMFVGDATLGLPRSWYQNKQDGTVASLLVAPDTAENDPVVHNLLPSATDLSRQITKIIRACGRSVPAEIALHCQPVIGALRAEMAQRSHDFKSLFSRQKSSLGAPTTANDCALPIKPISTISLRVSPKEAGAQGVCGPCAFIGQLLAAQSNLFDAERFATAHQNGLHPGPPELALSVAFTRATYFDISEKLVSQWGCKNYATVSRRCFCIETDVVPLEQLLSAHYVLVCDPCCQKTSHCLQDALDESVQMALARVGAPTSAADRTAVLHNRSEIECDSALAMAVWTLKSGAFSSIGETYAQLHRLPDAEPWMLNGLLDMHERHGPDVSYATALKRDFETLRAHGTTAALRQKPVELRAAQVLLQEAVSDVCKISLPGWVAAEDVIHKLGDQGLRIDYSSSISLCNSPLDHQGAKMLRKVVHKALGKVSEIKKTRAEADALNRMPWRALAAAARAMSKSTKRAVVLRQDVGTNKFALLKIAEGKKNWAFALEEIDCATDLAFVIVLSCDVLRQTVELVPVVSSNKCLE